MLRSSAVMVALAALTAMAAGCDCSAPGARMTCTAGEVNCECASGGRCLTGLECVGGLCTDPTGMTDSGTTPPMDAMVPPRADAGPGGPPDVGPNPDAFFADDPPPMVCLEDGGMGPPTDPPGGTPECPDDKNREGCRCDEVGSTAPCWPGLRANRNRGICRDGTTTCEAFDEFTGRWGACRGYVLPTEGVELGPAACRCFSVGRWQIDNLSPCFVDYGASGVYAVSTYVGGGGTAMCPTLPSGSSPPPAPQAGTDWSTDRLTVDCEGRFELCYTLRAGNADTPSPSDCMVARVCTGEFWYSMRDMVQELPPLPSWTSPDSACARQFRDSGGYGEMSVLGLSVECDTIDDGSGAEYVFNRVNYCPLRCNTDPTGAGCESCMMGGSGMF
ncbi:MAG: hypothetical protein H6719_27705 [Sandaracinaceae bacterium]|nr:hypothetical protein [Sandaracinaceae bacterium]